MRFFLGVEIDDNRVAWIYDSQKSKISSVKLTTVAENQRKAQIRIYLKRNEKKHLIATETISGIPDMHAGEPSIDFVPVLHGKSLEYSIYLNSRLVKRNTVALNKYIRSIIPLIIIGAVVLAAVIAAAFILLFKPFREKPVQAEKNFKTEKPVQKPETAAKPAGQDQNEVKEETRPAAEPASAPVEKAEEEPKAEEPAVKAAPPAEPVIKYEESRIADSISVYFEPDSSVLTEETKNRLSMFIQQLPSSEDFEEGSFTLEVRGHCAKFGTEEGRAELSRERAENVDIFLETRWGLESESSVAGAGASEPVTLKKDEQYLNRRVDINVIGSITVKTTE